MANIVFSRIDDRLIHGQVITGWLSYSGAERILIIDDLVAKDPFMLGVLEMAAPPGVDVTALTIEDSITKLKSDDWDQKILILTKTPHPILALVNNGVPIDFLNVGGMGSKPGRKKLYRNIQATEEEIEILKTLQAKGTNVEFRVVIEHKPLTLDEVLK
jgi:PTS system mannose-specific IIB component